jgi:hypothetical protein
MKPAKLTYRIDVLHPNSMQRIAQFKYKTLSGAKRAAKIYKKDWEIDVKRYKGSKLDEILNPDDFAR